MSIGEATVSHSIADIAEYVYPRNKELDMVFQFELNDIDTQDGVDADSPICWSPWKLGDMKEIIQKYQEWGRNDGFWNTWVACRRQRGRLDFDLRSYTRVFVENHDNARSVSRFGNDAPEWRALCAKMLCIFQVTLSGTLFVYQGQEIGMRNIPKSWPVKEYKDVATINFWRK